MMHLFGIIKLTYHSLCASITKTIHTLLIPALFNINYETTAFVAQDKHDMNTFSPYKFYTNRFFKETS